jgi:hypothetical protein
MSGYGDGWRLIENPEVAKETELAREGEVRARFAGRIEVRRITKTRLERAAEEATRRSNACEQEVSQTRAKIVKYEEDLVTQRDAKAQNETDIGRGKSTGPRTQRFGKGVCNIRRRTGRQAKDEGISELYQKNTGDNSRH